MASSCAAWRLGAVALSKAFRQGELDPRDVLDIVLERHSATHPQLNASVLVDESGAREAATQSAERWRRGQPLSRLDGVPVTVKDNIPVRALPCSWGSLLFADHIATEDDIAIERLRAAGAVLWAKTNTPELAMAGITENRVFGVTRNPWDLSRTPGGSSGGGAALVAAGVGPLGLGTDAAGSIRRPACYCGLVGVRPSTGLVARLPGSEGIAFPPLAADYQVIGPLARSVEDAALMLHVIAGPDRRDRASLGHALLPADIAPPRRSARVGLVAGIQGQPCDPAEEAATMAAAEALRRHGVEVRSMSPFWDPDETNALFATIVAAGVARVVRQHAGWEEKVTPIIRGLTEAGLGLPAYAVLEALDRIAALRLSCATAFAEVDAVLTPASATLPWSVGRPFPETIGGVPAGPRAGGAFSVVVNMLGLPAVALPGPLSPEGLPAGVQMIGAFGSDLALLSLSSLLEAALWPEGLPRPPGFA